MIAAERGNIKVVDYLTLSGADMDLRNEVLILYFASDVRIHARYFGSSNIPH